MKQPSKSSSDFRTASFKWPSITHDPTSTANSSAYHCRCCTLLKGGASTDAPPLPKSEKGRTQSFSCDQGTVTLLTHNPQHMNIVLEFCPEKQAVSTSVPATPRIESKPAYGDDR